MHDGSIGSRATVAMIRAGDGTTNIFVTVEPVRARRRTLRQQVAAQTSEKQRGDAERERCEPTGDQR